jgi:hypothetical protein
MRMGMNCQDFLTRLETGRPITRLLAWLHAGRCPMCAVVYRRWNAAKRELRQAEPLSAELRTRWIEAMHAAVSAEQALPFWRNSKLAWVAAAACLAGVLWWETLHVSRMPMPVERRWPREPELVEEAPRPETPPIDVAGTEVTPGADAAGDFAQLEARIKQLDDEVANLTAQAERLEARRTADEMIEHYSQWQF